MVESGDTHRAAVGTVGPGHLSIVFRFFLIFFVRLRLAHRLHLLLCLDVGLRVGPLFVLSCLLFFLFVWRASLCACLGWSDVWPV